MPAKKLIYKATLIALATFLIGQLYNTETYAQKLPSRIGSGKIRYTVNFPNLRGSVAISLWSLLGSQIGDVKVVKLPEQNGRTIEFYGTAPGETYRIKEFGMGLEDTVDPAKIVDRDFDRIIRTNENGFGIFPMPLNKAP